MGTRDIRKTYLCWAALVLFLSALACNARSPATEPTQPVVLTTPTSVVPLTKTNTPGGETAVAPITPAATDTPVPDVSGPGGCTLNAAYVADITIPDNTEMAPGTKFVKTWRVRNSGTCAWEEGTQLVFSSNERLNGPSAVNVPPVAPGSSTDISVELTAPDAPGTYRSTWQLQSPDGVRFGAQIYVQIVVPEPATATPTATLTPTPTATPEPGATLPDLVITNLVVDTDDPRQGIPLHIIATLRNQGASRAENVHWAWRVCVHEGCEYTEAPDVLALDPGQEIIAQMEYLFGGYATYTTEAWVDSREEIAESDETNNTRQLVIPVKVGLPDLKPISITFTPNPPVQGENVQVVVRVANDGSKDSGGFLLQWWGGINFPDPSCEWNVTGGLVAGGQTNMACTFVYNSWYANITTRALVDVNNSVVELDEDNNTLDLDTPVLRP